GSPRTVRRTTRRRRPERIWARTSGTAVLRKCLPLRKKKPIQTAGLRPRARLNTRPPFSDGHPCCFRPATSPRFARRLRRSKVPTNRALANPAPEPVERPGDLHRAHPAPQDLGKG